MHGRHPANKLVNIIIAISSRTLRYRKYTFTFYSLVTVGWPGGRLEGFFEKRLRLNWPLALPPTVLFILSEKLFNLWTLSYSSHVRPVIRHSANAPRKCISVISSSLFLSTYLQFGHIQYYRHSCYSVLPKKLNFHDSGDYS